MSTGGRRMGTKVLEFPRALTLVLLALAVGALVACNSAPERIPVPMSPTATADESVDAVATPPPSVAPTPAATAVASLADDDPATVDTVAAGDPIVDPAGNLIAVHQLRAAPDAFVDLATWDLFGATEIVLGAAGAGFESLGLIDVSWCAASDLIDPPPGSYRFAAVTSVHAPLGSGGVNLGHPLVEPAFEVPVPGRCTRGWVPVIAEAGSAAEAPVARYVVSVAGSSGLDDHVYQWELAAADPSPRQPESVATAQVGQTVTFNRGQLEGTTVTFEGWAELVDAPEPAPTARLVATLVRVCPATEDWPELGLAIEGWNLLGPADPSDRLGADPSAPIAGSCFEGWVEFAVPHGLVPTGFFAGDGRQPVTGFASWSLDDAAIAPPDDADS